jgi:hypothetical protein
VAGAFEWSRFPVIADIGGGIGSQLSSILDAHPSCRGILFDQPAVIAQAPDGRIERVGGDFFKGVAVQADAYLMRWVLHDWSDEESLGLLKNVRKVATPDARLMVVESVIPETAGFDPGKWMDLNMMVMATERERTAAEFRGLLERAGFALEQIVPTSSPLSIVVGKPGNLGA